MTIRPESAPATARGRPPVLAILVLLALALVPLALADPLPLVDLPNHLARAYVLANIDTSTVFARYCGIDATNSAIQLYCASLAWD